MLLCHYGIAFNPPTCVESPLGPDGCHEVETSLAVRHPHHLFLKDSLQANSAIISNNHFLKFRIVAFSTVVLSCCNFSLHKTSYDPFFIEADLCVMAFMSIQTNKDCKPLWIMWWLKIMQTFQAFHGKNTAFHKKTANYFL